MVFQTIINYLRPLSEDERNCTELLKEEPEFSLIKNLVKQRVLNLEVKNFNLSLTEDYEYYTLISEDPEHSDLLIKTNEKIRRLTLQQVFKEFAPNALTLIPTLIAPKVTGLDYIKQALTLQLFASENLHLLIVGDVNTGKTDLLKSINKLTQSSIYSKAQDGNLVYSLSGSTIQPGLLPRADKGICAIDDLNLMRKDERSNLVSAMDKGFVTINKPAIQEKLDARIRLLAAANPTGSTFSRTMESMRKQLPFDTSLLQKFHLIFTIRQADITRATHISKLSPENPQIKQEDTDFIREYVKYAETTVPEVNLDSNFEKQASEFIDLLKRKEYKYLLGITDYLKDTLTKLSKASARSELRNQAEQKDFDRAKLILELSLQI